MDESRKRRRLKVNRFEFDSLDNEDQRIIQQVMKNSLLDTKRVDVVVPDAPTYYPTVEEFADPIKFISIIRPEAEKYGICKIVPPPQWNPVCQLDLTETNNILFPTKLQNVSTLQQGEGFDDGKQYTFASYRTMAAKFASEWFTQHYGDNIPTYDQLARDYWEMVEVRTKQAIVEYGNDLDTLKFSSGFPVNSNRFPEDRGLAVSSSFAGATTISSTTTTNAGVKSEEAHIADARRCSLVEYSEFEPVYYENSCWNLTRLPVCKSSLLHHIKTPITGVNVPWLYVGMLFSSFCWHSEDNYLYSINYSHLGDVKQWYGVPPSESNKFEKASKQYLMESFRESPDLLHHMTTQIPPSRLQANGVSVYKVSQTEKTFVITFPKAFHCGFSYGFNCGEAVNFATLDWLVAGGEAEEKYRGLARGAVFSHHRLLFTLLHHMDTSKMSHSNQYMLASEIFKVVDEELATRPYIVSQGVRDLSNKVNLPPNNFSEISKKDLEYDDMRTCCLCNHICIFTAVACECDKTKVSCIRHFNAMCKCPKQKKFMLTWTSNQYLSDVKKQTLSMTKEEFKSQSLN